MKSVVISYVQYRLNLGASFTQLHQGQGKNCSELTIPEHFSRLSYHLIITLSPHDSRVRSLMCLTKAYGSNCEYSLHILWNWFFWEVSQVAYCKSHLTFEHFIHYSFSREIPRLDSMVYSYRMSPTPTSWHIRRPKPKSFANSTQYFFPRYLLTWIFRLRLPLSCPSKSNRISYIHQGSCIGLQWNDMTKTGVAHKICYIMLLQWLISHFGEQLALWDGHGGGDGGLWARVHYSAVAYQQDLFPQQVYPWAFCSGSTTGETAVDIWGYS